MAMSVSKALAKSQQRAERAEARLSRLREENEDALKTATRTAVVMAGALGMSYVKGRYPDKSQVMGLDSSLVIGGGLMVAAVMGWAGEQETIVESLGVGCLSVYAASKGYELGQEAAANA